MARSSATGRAKKATNKGPIQKAKNTPKGSFNKEKLPTADSSVKDTKATPKAKNLAKNKPNNQSKKSPKGSLNKETLSTNNSSVKDIKLTPKPKEFVEASKKSPKGSIKKEKLPTADSSVKDTKATPKAKKPTQNKPSNESKKSPKGSLNKQKSLLEDSLLKNTKASKLADLLKSKNVTAKKPMNFDMYAKELDWSSDGISDSDMDIFDESDDGLKYAEDDDEDIDVNMEKEEEDEEMSEITVDDDEEDEDEDDTLTDDELEPEDDAESKNDSDADFEIVKTVTRLDPKSETALFEFITQGKVAIKALCSQEKKESKKQLFAEESNGVYVDIKYKLPAYINQSPGARKLIELPFPEKNPSNSSICLILPDLSHNEEDRQHHDVDKQAREWADILRDKFGITGRDIAKIMTLTQMKRELRHQASSRKFIQSYDILLVDRSIFSSVVYHLGREVQKGGRLPIPFKVTARNVPEQIKKAYRLTQMDLRAGVCNVRVRMGNLNQGNNQLATNFVSAANSVFAYAPFGHKNIKTAQIVTDQQAIQLPFYVDFDPKTDLAITKPKAKRGEVLIDEVSTLPDNKKIKIDNGIVSVIKC